MERLRVVAPRELGDLVGVQGVLVGPVAAADHDVVGPQLRSSGFR
jgi:hypothetical protein